jgi:hypothetical protein
MTAKTTLRRLFIMNIARTLAALSLAASAFAVMGCAADRSEETSRSSVSTDSCVKTGCSGERCADDAPPLATTCEFRAEYACFRTAVCERGTDGQCGFRKTAALTSCLAAPPAIDPIDVPDGGR